MEKDNRVSVYENLETENNRWAKTVWEWHQCSGKESLQLAGTDKNWQELRDARANCCRNEMEGVFLLFPSLRIQRGKGPKSEFRQVRIPQGR
jgi:hypothetical protein